MRRMLRALARPLWWLWLPGRIRVLERQMTVLKACPCCGAVLVVGHEKVSVMETAPGMRQAVCRWGRAEVERKAQLNGMRKARGA